MQYGLCDRSVATSLQARLEALRQEREAAAAEERRRAEEEAQETARRAAAEADTAAQRAADSERRRQVHVVNVAQKYSLPVPLLAQGSPAMIVLTTNAFSMSQRLSRPLSRPET